MVGAGRMDTRKNAVKAKAAKGDGSGGEKGKTQVIEDELETCPTCKSKVLEDENGVECDVCQFWYHQICQDISEVQYKALSEATASGIGWTCKSCRLGVKKLMTKIHAISVKQDKLDEDVKQIKADTTDFRQRLERVEAVVDMGPSSVISELEDRERRKNSLVFFHVPESLSSEKEDRISHDLEEINKLCQTMMDVDLPEVQSAFRTGPKNDQRPRTLKVKFKEEGTADRLLTDWKQIPLQQRKRKSKIVIVADQTPDQRKERKRLETERERLQKELEEAGTPETKWIITKGNKLRKVKLQDQPQNRG